MKRFLKTIAATVRGRRIHRAEVSLPYVYLGTEYGGWPLLEGEITDRSLILSFGLGTDISFDLAAIERFGCRVIGFDPTPKSIAWLSRQTLPVNFTFHGIGIGAADGEADFFPPENAEHTSFSAQVGAGRGDVSPIRAPIRRLSTLLADFDLPVPDVLKMDIEGFEYEVLGDLLSTGMRPRQVLIEFHHTMYGIAAARTRAAVADLRAAGYALFFVSPGGLEYGFVHRR